jgi:hypothetical protein
MTLTAITKATATIVAVACLIVGAAVGIYDWHEVRPRLPQIRASLATFPAEDRNVPPNVSGFIWKLDQKLTLHVDSQVASAIVGQALPMKPFMWDVHSRMWSLLLPFHFDKETRTALYCRNIVYEDGRGLSNAAEYYFHRQPHELTPEQIAGVLAIDLAPSINSPTRHPDRYARTMKRLLGVYGAL